MKLIQSIQDEIKHIEEKLDELASRECAIAKTKLEEARLWLIAHLNKDEAE